MKILVCGGREYDNWIVFSRRLSDILLEYVPIGQTPEIIHGDAKGADFMARLYCKLVGLKEHRFPADWKTYGKSAGPVRNNQMLVEGNPDLVVAFPGGSGTAHMIKLSKKQKIEVIEVEDDS